MEQDHIGPGWPGIAARWTSSAKSGVGTALAPASRIWFTLSHGILNEVYYPRVDHACTRDLGLIVSAGRTGSSPKRSVTPAKPLRLVEAGVPAYRLENTALDGRYRIEKQVLVDPSGRRRAAGDQLHRRSPGATGRLSGLRAAGAAPGQSRRAATPPGSASYKGTPMLLRRSAGCCAGARLLGAVAAHAPPALSASPTAGSSSHATAG